MVYKLAEEDKTCGVEYINWDKHYSPIPKATCAMLKGQCPSCSGGSGGDAVEITCEEVEKLLHGETEPPREAETPRAEERPRPPRGGVPQ